MEIVNTCQAIARAHVRRDEMINSGDGIGVLAMNGAVDILTDLYNTQYHQWQILGGTSDIDSIALYGLDATVGDSASEDGCGNDDDLHYIGQMF